MKTIIDTKFEALDGTRFEDMEKCLKHDLRNHIEACAEPEEGATRLTVNGVLDALLSDPERFVRVMEDIQTYRENATEVDESEVRAARADFAAEVEASVDTPGDAPAAEPTADLGEPVF